MNALPRLAGALLCPVAALPTQAAGERSARVNYVLRCAGCHDLDGTGLASRAFRRFRDSSAPSSITPKAVPTSCMCPAWSHPV